MDNSTPSITTRTVAAHDGIAMTCDCCGQEAEPLLFFVHGWTCRRAYWQPQLAHFCKTYRAVAPDLPGHGETAGQGRSQWSVAAFGQDVAACAKALGAGRAVLIGHSMGGAVVLEAARLLKDTAAAVVLADTFVIDYGGLDAETIRQIAAPFETDFAGAIAGLVEQTSTPATPQSLKDRLVREMSAADPSWALPVWHDLLSWNPTPAFEELEIPVYAINGALVPESARRRCAPYVRETILAGAGHFLQMEDPGGFNRALEQILAGLR